jgi:hypothetical protein
MTTPSGPLVVNHGISAPSAPVDRTAGAECLGIRFSQHGDLCITSSGQGWLVPLDKTVTFWLEPAAAGSGRTWSIDAFQTFWNSSDLVADTGTY